MFGFGRPTPVAEHAAEGKIEQVYHEIRQTLRVTGVNLNFRTWASFDGFLPALWDAFRPNAGARGFEDAADVVRAEAATATCRLGSVSARDAGLGDSQLYQIRAALDLYHYVNPKLLVLTAATRLALDAELVGGGGAGADPIETGSPPRMYPMEMESEEPGDDRLEALFDDIKGTLNLPSINSDYRTLGLWPDYLKVAWGQLKPISGRDEYRIAGDSLRNTARALARQLPHRFILDAAELKTTGVDVAAVVKATARFEELLPGLIINVALLLRDWRDGADLARSPFAAAARLQRGKL